METFADLFAQYWGVLLAFILGGAVFQGIRNLFKKEEPLPEPIEHPEYANNAPIQQPPPYYNANNVSRSPYTDIS